MSTDHLVPKEAVEAVFRIRLGRASKRPDYRDAAVCDVIRKHLKAAAPSIAAKAVEAERERWDDWSEAIDWPTCPNEHSDPKAWIEGRDAARRAFIAALATPSPTEEDSP